MEINEIDITEWDKKLKEHIVKCEENTSRLMRLYKKAKSSPKTSQKTLQIIKDMMDSNLALISKIHCVIEEFENAKKKIGSQAKKGGKTNQIKRQENSSNTPKTNAINKASKT